MHWWIFLNMKRNKVKKKICATQVHGLLRGICGDAIEHDAGQHGAEQQRETARDSLNTGEAAVRRSTDYREPEVSITEILYRLHEKQITEREGKKRQAKTPIIY